MMTMRSFRIAAVLGVTVLGITSIADAAGLDGTGKAICATSETYDCAPNGECIRDTPEGVDLPRFIQIDFAAKTAVTKRISGEERKAVIDSLRTENGNLLLQGVQSDVGWSMNISQETGAMSLVVAGDQVGIVVFGNCTNLK
jgi:hypothetical protein